VLAARGGHIPGAANINWLDLMDRNNFLRLKPLAIIEAMLDDKKLTADKNIVTHCQSHHRSGLTYLVGKIIGLNIKAYDGSWSEWGNLENTPIDNPAN
jgi:thiosulfate/3-mercaptopyruvate sulfurtransferase